ncbi:MAG: DUF3137 domain-containing protein [Clostridia bacterium]|nr:DUF3137 domain-containing protein [Clostridia bacterium]
MKKKIKTSLLVAILSLVFMICSMFFLIITVNSPLNEWTDVSFMLVIVVEIISLIVFFISLCIYYTNGFKNTANVEINTMPEEFNILYKKLCDEHMGELTRLKQGMPLIRIGKWIDGAVAIVSAAVIYGGLEEGTLVPAYWWITVFITGLFFLYLSHCDWTLTRNYKNYYKQNCIKNFIALVNPNLTYDSRGYDKINEFRELYNDSKCDNLECTTLTLDDYIEGDLGNGTFFKIADVEARNRTKHPNGKSTTAVLFEGLLGVIEYNQYVKSHIRINTSNREFKNDSNKVQMDSAEFEKCFNAYCEDKILVTRILTADIMEMLVDFHKKYYLDFEIIIYKDKITMRFFTGPMFEPKVFGNALDKNYLCAYYALVKLITDLSKEVDKTMKEFQV